MLIWVFPGGDGALKLRNRRLCVAERARSFELRRDAKIEAILEEVVRPLVRLRAVLCNLQLLVAEEREEVGADGAGR
jgi:hypothetical protein